MAGGTFGERREGEEGVGEPAGGLGVWNTSLGWSVLKYVLFPWNLAAVTLAIRLREASFARPVKPFASCLFRGNTIKHSPWSFERGEGNRGIHGVLTSRVTRTNCYLPRGHAFIISASNHLGYLSSSMSTLASTLIPEWSTGVLDRPGVTNQTHLHIFPLSGLVCSSRLFCLHEAPHLSHAKTLDRRQNPRLLPPFRRFQLTVRALCHHCHHVCQPVQPSAF